MRAWPLILLLAACGGKKAVEVPEYSEAEMASAERLRETVEDLAVTIGGRGLEAPKKFSEAEAYITRRWEAQGYRVRRLPYMVGEYEVANLQVELLGRTHPEEIVVVGAHYDTCDLNPGANDNGSGVAAMLELSRAYAADRPARTLRFVAFANEEPPHFQRESMGSLVYAKAARAADEQIVGMLSLETMGYYTDAPDSQHYPAVVKPFFSSVGNFIAFVSNGRSRKFVKQVRSAFEATVDFPVESLAATDAIPGIGWSDHWSFYEQGYPSVMVTDTAPNRYAHYHTEQDTPDKLDYRSMSRVVRGLDGVVDALLTSTP